MLAPWRKSYDRLRQHIKEQRLYFADKSPFSQSYGFPIVMYGCKSWTIKMAECRRIDAFEMWCWRRLLRVSWTAKRSNQSILKEITPEYSLEGLMMNLKLQYIGHLMWWANPLEKILLLGRLKAGGQGSTEDEMHHQLNGFEFEQTLEDNEGQRSLACCGP